VYVEIPYNKYPKSDFDVLVALVRVLFFCASLYHQQLAIIVRVGLSIVISGHSLDSIILFKF